jgi:NTE family protein
MLAPSVDPREIAAKHAGDLPKGLQTLLRVIGGRAASGHQLGSYLMFESGYTRDLIELGYRDALAARSTLLAFMAGEKVPDVVATSPGVVAQAT